MVITQTKNKKILGLIPARCGSKTLPRKNIKVIAGKPLIAYTIEQGLKSKFLDRMIVSTDDEETVRISKQYGAEVPFVRPAELARDDSPTIDVVLHALDFFAAKGEYFDIFILLEPTSPLRKDDDIDNAIKLFLDNYDKADSLVSVGEVHLESPYITKKIENGYVRPLIETNKKIYQRQQLSKTYFPYGVIYLSKVEALKKYKTFYQERTIPYLIERWQNYEIDDIYDFIIVERVLNSRRGKPI